MQAGGAPNAIDIAAIFKGINRMKMTGRALGSGISASVSWDFVYVTIISGSNSLRMLMRPRPPTKLAMMHVQYQMNRETSRSEDNSCHVLPAWMMHVDWWLEQY